MADTPLDALSFSVDRLRDLTNALNDRELTRGAYPSEWSIADVLSHLGSGAVITSRRLDNCQLRSNYFKLWSLKLPPIFGLLLQRRNLGFLTRPGSCVAYDRSLDVYSIHTGILSRRTNNNLSQLE